MFESKKPRGFNQDAIDRAKLLGKRATKLVAESEELVHRAHHNWHMLAVGRVCTICETAQVRDEFDDDVPCRRWLAS
jgi:hypothetical protein